MRKFKSGDVVFVTCGKYKRKKFNILGIDYKKNKVFFSKKIIISISNISHFYKENKMSRIGIKVVSKIYKFRYLKQIKRTIKNDKS